MEPIPTPIQEQALPADSPNPGNNQPQNTPGLKFALSYPNFLKSKKFLAILVCLVLIISVLGFVSYRIYRTGSDFYQSAVQVKGHVDESDLNAIKNDLNDLSVKQNNLSRAYRLITPLKIIPFINKFVSDGDHAIRGAGYGIETAKAAIDAAEPYADILGLAKNSSESKDGQKTAQERLDFIVKSLPELIPKISLVSDKLKAARKEFEQIDPSRYPKSLLGKELRNPIATSLNLVIQADNFVTDIKPLLEVSPYLLGADNKREYLVLFQNDKELRPTGGFLTAYSIASVDKGKFEPVISSDMYSLDAKYKPTIPASGPIINYIKGPYTINKNYRLRDMNWSPDFKDTIELFLKEAKKVGIDNIDGVISVDTGLLMNILNVVGTVGVPGYGNFSTQKEPKCDCPQVIYELESFADVEGPIVWDPLNPNKIIYAPANIDNRKKIIGPLMNSILSNVLAQPKEKMPDLFNAFYKSVTEKHVMLYLHDEKSQKAAEDFGIAGRIENTDWDYLHINDANLGGRKSNLYVTQEVKQTLVVQADGTIQKTLEITYKNPQGYDGWLNSVLPNWTRIYVPKGSEIIDVSGFEDTEPNYEEFGKTVVSGGFKLRPQGLAKVTVTYKLPFKASKDYKLLIQKQPGTDTPLYTVEIGKQSDEFFLTKDTEKTYTLK